MLEQRLRFVVLATQRQKPISELCREFGISRQTGHLWQKRYAAGGARDVVDRSRRPLNSPRRTVAEIEQAVAELRRQRPDWGAAKLRTLLLQDHAETSVPCVRTIHRILERLQLISEKDQHRPALKRFERSAPNELWQMDFKGRPGTNGSVGPLSILDDHSRYVLALQHVGNTRIVGVRQTLESTFTDAGMPEALLIDHGTPWWNAASPWGLTELSVWIMRQGVRLLFSGIRHPQTQGKVERMHGALQRAVRKRRTDLTDQSWLDSFRYEYNHVRPHEALQMATPASRWTPSLRRYRGTPGDWEYPAGMTVMQLAGDGQLCWQGRRWAISNALRRQYVGIEVVADRALVYFYNTPLRELNLSTGACSPLPVRLTL